MNKAGKTTITLSAVLILVLLTASIYIFIPDKVKLTVEDTKSSFFVWEDDSWVLGATEYVHLYDGTKKMRASSRDVSYETIGDITTITRLASWKDNISTIDTYTFDSTTTDVTLFPISHTLEVTNAVGKIVHFEYRDILYNGETRVANSPESFGHQMKVEWNDGNYYAKVFQQSVASDKLIIRYRPTSDYEVYNVRMFDPPEINLSFNSFEDVDVTAEDDSLINISAVSTDSGATVCLSADITSLGDDFSCGTGSTWYLWNSSSENNLFSDNSTWKNAIFDSAPEAKNVTLESFSNSSITKSSSFVVSGNYTIFSETSTMYADYTPTGSPYCISNMDPDNPCENAFDGDYATWSKTLNDTTSYIIESFECDSCVGEINESILQYKYYNSVFASTENVTLEDYGCQISPVKLRTTLTDNGGVSSDTLTIECLDDDGEGYNSVASETTTSLRFYEMSLYSNDVVRTYNTSQTLAKNVVVDFQDDDAIDFKIVGYIGENYSYIDEFYDNSSYLIYDFTGSGKSETSYIRISKDFDGERATFDVTGYSNNKLHADYYYGMFDNSYYTESDGDYDNTPYAASASDDAGMVYNFGGQAIAGVCDDAGDDYNCSLSFNSETRIMTKLDDVPYEMGTEGCAVYDSTNNQIFVMGGVASSTYNDENYAYNVDTGEWSMKSSMSHPLAYMGCSYANGAIYTTGGYTTGDAVTYGKYVYKYNISDDSWSQRANLTYARYAHWQGTLNDNSLIVVGYFNDKAEIYNISDDSWALKADHPSTDVSAIYANTGWVSADSTKVFITGGVIDTSPTTFLSDVWVYHTANNSWTTIEQSNGIDIYYTDAVVVNNHAHIINYATGATSEVYKYYYLPKDISVTIGELSYQTFSNDLYTAETSTDFSSTISSYSADCTAEIDGSCLMPVTIYNDGVGIVNISNLNILVKNDAITLSSQTITYGLSSCNPVINFYSDDDGTLNVSNINVSFYGTDIINFTADDETYTTSSTVTNYFTNYSYAFPASINYFAFYPYSVSLNVTPFGQTASIPVLNLTADNIDGNSTLSFKYVSPTSCIKLYKGSSYSLVDTEDFEVSLGDWSNDITADYNWTRITGETSSSGTGPTGGAHSGSYYIFVETSSFDGAYLAGDEDIIEYNATTDNTRVDFYYSQYGADQGTLYLEGYDTSWHEIWSSTGDQGDQWNHEDESFTSYDKIRFRNVAAGGYMGDVALDLVKIYTDATSITYTAIVNDTWTSIWDAQADAYNIGLYLTGNYDCSSSFTQFFSPNFYLRSCASDADICSEATS